MKLLRDAFHKLLRRMKSPFVIVKDVPSPIESRYDLCRRVYGVGLNSYVAEGTFINPHKVKIGRYCSIASGCHIGLSDHPLDRLSTHPFTYAVDGIRAYGEISVAQERVVPLEASRPVQIGNDVWIATGSTIMSGVSIGNGAVVGACSVVTHDVPPYAIVVGSPARIVRYRFPPETVRRLQATRWWDRSQEFIAELDFTNVESCLEKLERQ